MLEDEAQAGLASQHESQSGVHRRALNVLMDEYGVQLVLVDKLGSPRILLSMETRTHTHKGRRRRARTAYLSLFRAVDSANADLNSDLADNRHRFWMRETENAKDKVRVDPAQRG